MLSECGILPPLSLDEAIENYKNPSVAGKTEPKSLLCNVLFVASRSYNFGCSLVGGGTYPQREKFLSSNGVYFLTASEFNARFRSMRQPLEDRVVQFQRAKLL